MKIQLDSVKSVVLVIEQRKDFSEIEVVSVTDDSTNKKAVANIKEIGFVTLWEGADYDAIGQWTDNDVVTRIKQIYE